MNNPNPCDKGPAPGPALDPFDDPAFDPWRWIATIEFRLDPQGIRELAILRWLRAAGFVQVQVQPLPERGLDWWQAIMRRGTNRRCPTGLAAQEFMNELAADLGCRIQEASGLAWEDKIGVVFKLRTLE